MSDHTQHALTRVPRLQLVTRGAARVKEDTGGSLSQEKLLMKTSSFRDSKGKVPPQPSPVSSTAKEEAFQHLRLGMGTR